MEWGAQRGRLRGGGGYTENGGHDADAWIRYWLVGAADAEFGEGREAGGGEFCAAAFWGHGCGFGGGC